MQILFNGFTAGLTIAVLALAFAVVYMPTRVFHFGLGGAYAAVPFVTLAALHHAWPVPAAIGAGVILGMTVSVVCEAANHWWLQKKNATPQAHLISSLGIYIVTVQTVVLLWGTQTHVLRKGLDSVVTVGSVVLTGAQCQSLGVSAFLLLGSSICLKATRAGLSLKALAGNPREFGLQGYNPRWTRLLAFGLSGLLASASSLLAANDNGFAANNALSAVLPAMVAMIIGGRQSFLGVVVGGVSLGILQSEVVYFLSSKWEEPLVFLLLTISLFFRRSGTANYTLRPEAGV